MHGLYKCEFDTAGPFQDEIKEHRLWICTKNSVYFGADWYKLLVVLDGGGLPIYWKVVDATVPDSEIYQKSGFEAALKANPRPVLNLRLPGMTKVCLMYVAGDNHMGPYNAFG